MSTSRLALLSVLALCSTAVASAPTAAHKTAPAKRPDCGDSYEIGRSKQGRTALTQAQVDEVMKTKVGEVTACWQRLPDDKRKRDTTAVIELEIDDRGEVQTVEVAGVPDDAERCIALAAVGWDFPETDVKADAVTFSYAVPLRTK